MLPRFFVFPVNKDYQKRRFDLASIRFSIRFSFSALHCFSNSVYSIGIYVFFYFSHELYHFISVLYYVFF